MDDEEANSRETSSSRGAQFQVSAQSHSPRIPHGTEWACLVDAAGTGMTRYVARASPNSGDWRLCRGNIVMSLSAVAAALVNINDKVPTEEVAR